MDENFSWISHTFLMSLREIVLLYLFTSYFCLSFSLKEYIADNEEEEVDMLPEREKKLMRMEINYL